MNTQCDTKKSFIDFLTCNNRPSKRASIRVLVKPSVIFNMKGKFIHLLFETGYLQFNYVL